MAISPSVAGLLPRDSGEWESVAGGESGASVVFDRGHQRYAKIVSSEQVAELAAERVRGVWLNKTAIPSAAVLDWWEADGGACLVTQAMLGVPASELGAADLRRAWPSVAGAVRALLGLSTDGCPFDRTLAKMMLLAEASVAEDRVVVEFLPVALKRTSPSRILEQIELELPVRLVQERTHLVVCHGDLCLPNMQLKEEAAANTAPSRAMTSSLTSMGETKGNNTVTWAGTPSDAATSKRRRCFDTAASTDAMGMMTAVSVASEAVGRPGGVGHLSSSVLT